MTTTEEARKQLVDALASGYQLDLPWADRVVQLLDAYLVECLPSMLDAYLSKNAEKVAKAADDSEAAVIRSLFTASDGGPGTETKVTGEVAEDLSKHACKHERGIVWQYQRNGWDIWQKECGVCWAVRTRTTTQGTGEWSQWGPGTVPRPASATKIETWAEDGKTVGSLQYSAETKNWALATEAIRAIRKRIEINHNERVEDAVARKIDSLETAVRDLVHEQDRFVCDLQAVLGGSPTKLVETAKTLMKSLTDTRRVLGARSDEDTAEAARRVLASFSIPPETT